VQKPNLTKEQLVGGALRAVRIKCKWSQNQLALISEVDRNYISLIEQGKNSPSVRMLFRLCFALDIIPSDLLKGVEKSVTEALLRNDDPP
jgi:transcriptional regulator with XRE-family HTH domain